MNKRKRHQKGFGMLGKTQFPTNVMGKSEPLKYNSGEAINLFGGKTFENAKVHAKKKVKA